MRYEAAGFVPLEAVPTTPIDQKTFDEVRNAKQRCAEALAMEERLKLVIDNFWEWEVELLGNAETYLLWGSQGHQEAMRQRLTLDRRFVNLLSAFRLYLDQTAHSVSSMCGKGSFEVERVELIKNALYDEHFGYRFIEALRNYVQHRGLPVHLISYQMAREETEEAAFVRFSVGPVLKVEDLARDGGIKRQIMEELQRLGNEIDLRIYTRVHVSCLTTLHKEVRHIVADIIQRARATYDAAIVDYATINGKPTKWAWLQRCEDSGHVLEKVELVKDFLELYDALFARISQVNPIGAFYASNATHKVRNS